MIKYQKMWHEIWGREAARLRAHPEAFAHTIELLQHELEREAREVLRVQGVKLEDDR